LPSGGKDGFTDDGKADAEHFDAMDEEGPAAVVLESDFPEQEGMILGDGEGEGGEEVGIGEELQGVLAECAVWGGDGFRFEGQSHIGG
jgi:hypothetical protein